MLMKKSRIKAKNSGNTQLKKELEHTEFNGDCVRHGVVWL